MDPHTSAKQFYDVCEVLNPHWTRMGTTVQAIVRARLCTVEGRLQVDDDEDDLK